MGRNATPSALKLVKGNPGKRAMNKQEPDPDYLQDLTPPDWLPEDAKVVWNEVAPKLAASKLLTEVDVSALAMGCVALAQYRLAIAQVGKEAIKSKVVLNDAGTLVNVGEHINPWALIQSMTFKQAMTVFEKFGMTPQARTRIAVQPQGDLFGGEKTGADKYF